jgi:hypothetical protein
LNFRLFDCKKFKGFFMTTEEQVTQLKTVPPPWEPSQYEVAMQIADSLGEREFQPRATIAQIVRALGRTQSLALLEETRRIEAGAGIPVPDGSRRRTPGGVFFYLAYTTGKPKEGKTLRRPGYGQKQKKKKNGQSGQNQSVQSAQKRPAQPQLPIFTWENHADVFDQLAAEKGRATTVKITLVGRPGKVIDRVQCKVTTMESTKKPLLPKGLPVPEAPVTTYTVYIANKQWKKVAEAIADPEDILIVEGFPHFDGQTNSIAVFSTSVTTRNLQMAKRGGGKGKDKSAENAEQVPAAS